MLSQNSPQTLACQIQEDVAHQILSKIFHNLRTDTKNREKYSLEILAISDQVATNLTKWSEERQAIMRKQNDAIKDLKVTFQSSAEKNNKKFRTKKNLLKRRIKI